VNTAAQTSMRDEAGASVGESNKRIPGEAGLWVFIFCDLMVFSLFFGTFLFYRAFEEDVYLASQAAMGQGFGMLNTLLMLTSSWFVVMAVEAARRGIAKLPSRLLMLAFACGVGFAIIKYFEYNAKLSVGTTPTTNNFYMFYFLFTGIHFFHVLVGMGILSYFSRFFARRNGHYSEKDIRNLECGACYWHVVDLLWILLFGLLYLVQ